MSCGRISLACSLEGCATAMCTSSWCDCPCHAQPVAQRRLGRITDVTVIPNGGTFTVADHEPGPKIRLTGDLAELPPTPEPDDEAQCDCGHGYVCAYHHQVKCLFGGVDRDPKSTLAGPKLPTPEREAGDTWEFRLLGDHELRCPDPTPVVERSDDACTQCGKTDGETDAAGWCYAFWDNATIAEAPRVPAPDTVDVQGFARIQWVAKDGTLCTADIADPDSYDAGRLRDQLGERDSQIRELQVELGRLALENRRLAKGGRR